MMGARWAVCVSAKDGGRPGKCNQIVPWIEFYRAATAVDIKKWQIQTWPTASHLRAYCPSGHAWAAWLNSGITHHGGWKRFLCRDQVFFLFYFFYFNSGTCVRAIDRLFENPEKASFRLIRCVKVDLQLQGSLRWLHASWPPPPLPPSWPTAVKWIKTIP